MFDDFFTGIYSLVANSLVNIPLDNPLSVVYVVANAALLVGILLLNFLTGGGLPF